MRLQAASVRLVIVVSHRVKGGQLAIMIRRVVKYHGLHAVHRGNLVREPFCLVVCNAVNHDLVRPERDELLRHHVKPLPCHGVRREVGGQVVFHLDPALGKRRKNDQHDVQKENQVAFVHDQVGKTQHEIFVRLVFGFGTHVTFPSLKMRTCII